MSDVLWIRADAPDSKKDRRLIVSDALAGGIKSLILRPEDSDLVGLGIKNVLYAGNPDGDALVAKIETAEDVRRVLSRAGSFKAVVLEHSGDSVIPLENIIAGLHGSDVSVLVEVTDADGAKVCLNALEAGADGLVLCGPLSDFPCEIKKLAEPPPAIVLSEVGITGMKITETGDRSCIDTVSVMDPSEGMLVGSQSSCLFLVASESEENEFINSRPFRVNAGAVHSYILVPDGMTRYISEIGAGDTVLIVSKDGTSRKTTVGRSKTERRPLILVRASDGENEYSVILQYAETVKLIGPGGNLPVTSLKEGDRVFALLSGGGRHCGIPIAESVIEK